MNDEIQKLRDELIANVLELSTGEIKENIVAITPADNPTEFDNKMLALRFEIDDIKNHNHNIISKPLSLIADLIELLESQ